jgi:aspartate kinase
MASDAQGRYILMMPITVQKFGGTSVADANKIHRAARRAVRAKLAGNQVVLVVSAMGHTTDKLVKLASQVTSRPSRRELDMLLATGEQMSIALMAMAIHDAGYEAVSLTGAQINLRTDSAFTRARIHSIDATRITELLDRGTIVIVAGFQGVDADLNITTLGRGGSDTTAVAVAAALGAEVCEIYTDVDGVYTADPRIVPQARRIAAISYDEMHELASLGAGVMHSRSIEFAKKFGVVVHVRSSLTDTPGTVIMSQPPGMEDVVVRGATLKRGIGRATLIGVPAEPRVIAEIFTQIAERSLVVDDIIQNVIEPKRSVNLSFTFDAEDASDARGVADAMAERFGVADARIVEGLAKVSVVGVGMRSHTGVAAKVFSALASEHIAIQNVSTSEIVISVVVDEADGERALRALHKTFELDRGPES